MEYAANNTCFHYDLDDGEETVVLRALSHSLEPLEMKSICLEFATRNEALREAYI